MSKRNRSQGSGVWSQKSKGKRSEVGSQMSETSRPNRIREIRAIRVKEGTGVRDQESGVGNQKARGLKSEVRGRKLQGRIES